MKSLLKRVIQYDPYESFLWHRSLVPGKRALPAFIIAGVQKGGTTALANFLNHHPQITGPYRKEICYYDQSHRRNLTYYQRFFPIAKKGKISYDATPSYFGAAGVPERISKDMPNVKLILSVRSPLERLLSHYRMSVKMEWEHLSLPEALEAEPHRLELIRAMHMPMQEMWTSRYAYAHYSRYATHLTHWLQYFPREQFLFLDHSETTESPELSYKRIFRFLELDEQHDQAFFKQDLKKVVFSHADKQKSSSGADEIPLRLREELTEEYKDFLSCVEA